MNLKVPPKIELTPQQALALSDKVLTSPIAKPGQSYYRPQYGEIVLRAVRRLMAYKSKSSTINCMQTSEDPRTLGAKFSQGRMWLLDGGIQTVARQQEIDPDEWERLTAAVESLVVSIKRYSENLR